MARWMSGFPTDTGTALGVTAALAEDAEEVPAALVAVTVNVYAVRLARPVTVAVVDPAVEVVCPPGAAVTVYPVIGEPPSLVGAVHDTTAWLFPAVADTPVGAPGTVTGAWTTQMKVVLPLAEVPSAAVAMTV